MEKVKKILIDYSYIAVGSFILAFAITFFLVPCKISTGGVSGFATVVYYVSAIPLSLTVFTVNILLFVIGYRTLQKSSIAKTIAGIVFLSLFLEITAKFGQYSEDVFIASVFGGILVGVGVALPVMKNASTGGSDFAGLMLNKKFPHISVATFILIIDTIVILSSGIVFEDYTITFYSVVSLYISTIVTDRIIVSGNFAKSVFIISDKYSEIAVSIMNDMRRGVTGIYSYGCYQKKDSSMLMCIVRNREIPFLMEKIKSFDRNAFTVISEVREVHGEGFSEV